MKNIGKYVVHDNQEDAANRLFQAFLREEIPYLTALTQSGKTGCLIEFMRLLLDHCIDEGVSNPIVLYVCMLSDTSLKDQADKDIREAFDSGYRTLSAYALLGGNNPIIRNMHHPDLKKFLPPNGSTVFSIFDEIQERTNKGGLFDQTCLGIKEKDVKWHKFFSSATPYPYDLLKNDYPNLVPVVLYPGSGYYGLKDYFHAGRFRKGMKPFVGAELSDFMKDHFIPDCIFRNQVDGAGYVLIRNNARKDQDKQEENLQAHISEVYETDIDVKCVNSKEDNIYELELLLKSKPEKLTFVFIKNALRAGKRLSKEYIRGALDTVVVNNAASMVQSLAGRLTGYDVKNTNFNIYCDTSHIPICIKHWQSTVDGDKLNVVPSSRYNKTNVEEKRGTCNISFYSSLEDAVTRAKEIGIDTESEKYGVGSKISTNNAIDVADKAIRCSVPSKHGHIFELDDFAPNHEDSWKALLAQYGSDKRGKYMLFEPCEEKIVTQTISYPNGAFISDNRTRNDLN